jgi:hypothetical protein
MELVTAIESHKRDKNYWIYFLTSSSYYQK